MLTFLVEPDALVAVQFSIGQLLRCDVDTAIEVHVHSENVCMDMHESIRIDDREPGQYIIPSLSPSSINPWIENQEVPTTGQTWSEF